MTSLARIRPSLRRAAFVAALGALMVPATAGASVHAHAAKKRKVKLPVVTRVTPLHAAIGQRLEIRGRNFLRGRHRNTVVFKRTGGKAVFVKASIGTTKLLLVALPAKLQKELVSRGGTTVPTRFRVRVLSKKFGKRFTRLSLSPMIAPAPLPGSAVVGSDSITQPDADCDGDGVLNKADTDDDNDLLSDSEEVAIGTDSCKADTDGDGVEDGYEYQSARDLNDDEYQDPNRFLPYPGKRPYPNPLFKDADVDYDGDSLTLAEEFKLWNYVGDRKLFPLSYSDGEQYSVSRRAADGHREPTLAAAGYSKQADFVANLAGYRKVTLWDGTGSWFDADHQHEYGLFDVNRRYGEEPTELNYYDLDHNSYLSDEERDEDADGLTNYDETHGRMRDEYWKSCYTMEKPYYIGYESTSPTDADSDGDGIRDGADDQDHDDIPNLDELSRIAASGRDDRKKSKDCQPKDGLGAGNFSVSGGPLPDGAVVVTFENQLGNLDFDEMTASGAGLTGVSSAAVPVATTRPGGDGVDEQQTVRITGGPTG